GEVGKRIGAILAAMGVDVIAVRRNPQGTDEYGPADLQALLPRANMLVITVPHTPETEGLIGREQLAAMPDDSILVNVARAQIVDEEALYDALKSGKLH